MRKQSLKYQGKHLAEAGTLLSVLQKESNTNIRIALRGEHSPYDKANETRC